MNVIFIEPSFPTNQHEFVRALHAAGANVIPYPTFSFLRVLSPEIIGNDIIGKALDVRNAIDSVNFGEKPSAQTAQLPAGSPQCQQQSTRMETRS